MRTLYIILISILLIPNIQGSTTQFDNLIVIGGDDVDFGEGFVLDSKGNYIIVGGTLSSNYPVENNQYSKSEKSDAILSKIAPNGEIIFSTYIGGSENDEAVDVIIDKNDDIYILGITYSIDFPATLDTINQTSYMNIFLTKFSSNGVLLWSTVFGGESYDVAVKLLITSTEDIVVTGYSRSKEFPHVNSNLNESESRFFNPFIAKYNSNGELIYSHRYNIKLDIRNAIITTALITDNDDIYLAGFHLKFSDDDILLLGINNQGMVFMNTSIGGKGDDMINNMLYESETDSLLIIGTTKSENITDGAKIEYSNGFLAKFSNGSIVWEKSIEGSADDEIYALAANEDFIFLAGNTASTDFMMKNQYDCNFIGLNEAFLQKYNRSDQSLILSTYVGGNGKDYISDIIINKENVYIKGATYSDDFGSGSTGESDFFIIQQDIKGLDNMIINNECEIDNSFSDPVGKMIITIGITGLIIMIIWDIYKKYS